MFSLNFHNGCYFIGGESSPLIFVVGLKNLNSHDDYVHIIELKEIFKSFNIPFIYKLSLHDDNNIIKCINKINTIRKYIGIPVMTTITTFHQVEIVADITDIVLISSGIERLNEILVELGRRNKPLILAKELSCFSCDMTWITDYARNAGVHNLALCEGGTSFGYDDTVVDMRSITIMQDIAPVFFNASYAFNNVNSFFDLCHKVSMASVAYGAAALGLAGIIMDILPDVQSVDSNAPGMLTMGALPFFLEHILKIDRCAKDFDA